MALKLDTELLKLRELRQQAAQEYKIESSKWEKRREIRKIKEDIRKIKAAKLRAKIGITRDKLGKSDPQKTNDKPKKILKGTVKFFGALFESINDYEKDMKRRQRG